MTAPVPATPRPVGGDGLDEMALAARFARLKKLVAMQTWAIGGLSLIFAAALPFTVPVYSYFAVKPDKHSLQMVGLNMPNMTNRAVLSWATTSITEIMTMGFGDMDSKLPRQRWRFTQDGWDAYTKAFVNQKIGETFKQNQLVLTTAPADAPVITGQGVNASDVYQWNLQLPVIMTYATNNNVTERKRALINLSVVRAPLEENPAGIAIQNWNLED